MYTYAIIYVKKKAILKFHTFYNADIANAKSYIAQGEIVLTQKAC